MEVAVNTGCVLFKEGDYGGAAAKFKEAAALDSSNPVRPARTVEQACIQAINSRCMQLLRHLARHNRSASIVGGCSC